MAELGDSAPKSLSDLRAKIDLIDAKMHRLLMERSSVVDALIAAKGTTDGRPAFRPQREAEMMRRLVKRHQGNLPLATIEHLWREIVSTFTFMQAPFRIIVCYGSDPVAIHNLARFAFGFAVELVQASDPAELIAEIAATNNDLGLIPLEKTPARSPWWRKLSMANGPRIMTIWPFIAGKGRLADAPALIVSPALAEPTPPDLSIYAASDGEGSPSRAGIITLAESRSGGRRELLLATDRNIDQAALVALDLSDIVEIGGAARGLTLATRGDGLRTPIGGGDRRQAK